MQIENLRDKDVETLSKTVEEIRTENPNITSRIYQMPDPGPSDIEKLTVQIQRLTELMEFVFGGHVLINGNWVRPADPFHKVDVP